MFDEEMAHVERLMARLLKEQAPAAWGTVLSYDETTHTARVRMEPGGGTTGDLPVATVAGGLRLPLRRGDTCRLDLDAGEPVAVAYVIYTTRQQPPAAHLVLEGDVWVGGQVTTARPSPVPRVATLPTPRPELRGSSIILSDGGTTTADVLYVCLQGVGGAVAWHAVPTG